MFDFPASPTLGQPFTPVSGGPAYAWDGTAWRMTSGGISAGVFIGDAPPANPVPGQLWWRSSSGETFIYFSDGSSSQWVQFNASPIPAAVDWSPFKRSIFVVSNSTFQFDATTKAADIEVVGGGGAGGGSGTPGAAGTGTAGGGGGGAGLASKLITLNDTIRAATKVITIGAGGTATTSNGNAGGTSTYDDGTNSVSGVGGGGGQAGFATTSWVSTIGGTPGGGSGGLDFRYPGEPGQAGIQIGSLIMTGTSCAALGGNGGSAGKAIGSGGAGARINGTSGNSQVSGSPANAYGAGGGGAAASNAFAALGGGAGSSGAIIITEYR